MVALIINRSLAQHGLHPHCLVYLWLFSLRCLHRLVLQKSTICRNANELEPESGGPPRETSSSRV